MGTHFAEWLEDKPYRFTILNMLGLTLLLAMVESTRLFLYVGGAAAAMTALFAVLQSGRLTLHERIVRHPYDLALLWLPGAVALLLTCVSLYLVATNPLYSNLYWMGVLLYSFQISLLVMVGAELGSGGVTFLSYLKG